MATDNILSIDFTNAPPAQGGGGTDYVKPGDYIIEIVSAERGVANTGRKKITVDYVVSEGPCMGSRLRDIFTLPKDANDSLFGVQKFHAALMAYGFPMMKGKVQIPLDKLAGRKCKVRVGDSELPANGQYEAKTVAKIQNYAPLGQVAEKPKAVTAPPVDDEDPDEPTVPANVLDDDDPFGDDK